MKFQSEKSSLMALLIFAPFSFVLTMLIRTLIYDPGAGAALMIPSLLLLPMGFVLWLWFQTGYAIEDGKLNYVSGPFRGSIAITSIREVRVASSWKVLGKKPALSTNGLLISYNSYDDIFISPEDKKSFIAELQRYNPAIYLNLDQKPEKREITA
jgi:hypothetical protein